MTPKKAKRIGLIVICIFTIIHSYFYIKINAEGYDFITEDSLYLFDIITPFSILSTLLFGQKVGERVIINYQKGDNFIYAGNILAYTTTIVLVIYSLIAVDFNFNHLRNDDFVSLCVLNVIGTLITFLMVKAVFVLFRKYAL